MSPSRSPTASSSTSPAPRANSRTPSDQPHAERLPEAMRGVDGVVIKKVSDRTFLLHLGGKIEVTSKVPLRTRDDMSMAYTPGVARVCLSIAAEPGGER